MTDAENLALFALAASRPFAERIAAVLAVSLSDHEEREFEDGEHKARPLVNVRGKAVFVVQSLYSEPRQSVNDKLCRLLFFIGCLKDAAARSVTVLIPYLAYARKDRKTQPRDPVTTRYLAALLEAVGSDRVVVLDVHNLAAFQNAFRCATEHLEARRLFVEHFAPLVETQEQVTVVSPDAGGMKRAEQFRQALQRRLRRDVSLAFMEKERGGGRLRTGRLVGDAGGGVAIILDDLISTGGTLRGAAEACREQGARTVYAAASHGVFVGGANEMLAADAIEQTVVTDSIPPFRVDPALLGRKLLVLSAAELFAEAICRIHGGGSLVELLTV
jgi:ribose-phosphate pyrophosphokinase